MKTSEKVLIGLVLLTFSLQFFFLDIPNLIAFVCLILGGAYAIGGYIILNDENKSENFLSVIGGIIFASSIIILPYIINHPWHIVFKIITLFNLSFCLGLAVYLIWKRKNNNKIKKQIFIHSLIILLVTVFLASSDSLLRSSSFYRTIIKTVNKNNSMYNNMKGLDYLDKVAEYLENGNCDLAIDYAHKAKKEALLMLEVNYFDLRDTSLVDEFWEIRGVFSDLYGAYRCKADDFYEKRQFEQALIFYQEADSFLVFNQSKSWDRHRTHSATNIAHTFTKLGQYKQADSFYVEAINRYRNSGVTSEYTLVSLFQDLSESFILQEDYVSANFILKKANLLAENDSKTNQIKSKHYIRLTNNYLQLDSLDEAKINLDSLTSLITEEHPSYGIYFMIKGIYSHQKNEYEKSTEYYLQALEECEKKTKIPTVFVQLYRLLGRNMITLAKYEKAKEYIEEGLSLIASENLESSIEYTNLLMLKAELKFNLGKYDEAKELYTTVLQKILVDDDESSTNFIGIYTSLSEVELKFLNVKAAKNYADKAILIAKENEIRTPSSTSYINNAAYVNYFSNSYRIADTLYNSTIKIHHDFNQGLSTELANAYNGLGLIALDKRQYKKADTLFLKSLAMNEVMFEDSHPNIATIQYNQALLRMHQDKDQEAEDLLNSAYKTFEEYYGENHDEIADVYVALGNIAKKSKDKKLAKEFYTKSHIIFKDIFGDHHAKTQMTKRLLK